MIGSCAVLLQGNYKLELYENLMSKKVIGSCAVLLQGNYKLELYENLMSKKRNSHRNPKTCPFSRYACDLINLVCTHEISSSFPLVALRVAEVGCFPCV